MKPGVEGLPDRVAPGLMWYRFDQGYFNDNPKWFKNLNPTSGDVTLGWSGLNLIGPGPGDDSTNTLPVSQSENFSFLIKGYFVPKVSGIHRFTLGSDDASFMWWGAAATVATAEKNIHDASISNPGVHPPIQASVSFNMSAGTAYPLAIMYGQKSGGYNLTFAFTPPGGQETNDGTGVYYSMVTSDTVIASALRPV